MQLATKVAANVGVYLPSGPTMPEVKTSVKQSPALSQMNLLAGNIKSRKVAILIAPGVKGADIDAMVFVPGDAAPPIVKVRLSPIAPWRNGCFLFGTDL